MQRPTDGNEAAYASSGFYGGMLMLMMRGLCGRRFTQSPSDADDARPLWAQAG